MEPYKSNCLVRFHISGPNRQFSKLSVPHCLGALTLVCAFVLYRLRTGYYRMSVPVAHLLTLTFRSKEFICLVTAGV